MSKLEGKVAVITGGSTGIGLATAQLFAAEGAHVFISGRRQGELDAAVRLIGKHVSGVQGDVSNLADLDRLYATVKQQHRRIDILFANAGGGEFVPLGSISEEHFDKTFGTNVKGLLFTVQKALPLLQDGGSIILNASTAASAGVEALSVYCTRRPRCGRSPGAGPPISSTARSVSMRSVLVRSTHRASMAWYRMRSRPSSSRRASPRPYRWGG